MTPEQRYSNRLIQETSPYLRQHAHNPVAWQPWDEKALAQAQEQQKPILLSIGYSACHWCHVMAHESFEDEATAQVMNDLFINIKVDREERPDLDKIYQNAFQLLHQRAGGWPLTMFLTHDEQIPFVGGTYFPKVARYGMPAFVEILHRVSHHYQHHRHELSGQKQALLEALRFEGTAPTADAVRLHDAPLQMARDGLLRQFDPQHGGFGGAPKFPHPSYLERLLRHSVVSNQRGAVDEAAQAAVLFTLQKMALGGIYDQLGGGFYRYSVDGEWQIPHFEKMLYDNGPLLALYAQAWQASQAPWLRRVVEETAAWVMRDMQAPQGGYYATLDADSEGEEGKFYLWTPQQVQALLSSEEFSIAATYFGLDGPPNFEHQAWHLRVSDIRFEQQLDANTSAHATEHLENARRQLLLARNQRVWPGRDEKILTSWNGLMIRGMAIASRHLSRPDFMHSAEQALRFVQAHLWRDGRLLAVYKDQQSRLNAYLDDYAFLIDGILELLQCRWRDGELDFALALADVLLNTFEDREAGGFYFTAADHEQLIYRPKSVHDDALPAGNGIAAQVLLKLGHLTGRTAYLDAAERMLRWAWPNLIRMPTACNTALTALEDYLEPMQIIVLRGEAGALLDTWAEHCAKPYVPHRLVLAIPATANLPEGLLAERRLGAAPVTAYVCAGLSCLPPITDLAALEGALR